jgi:pre-rRNA-processing protein TSR4
VCGILSSKRCSECNKVCYCSKEHQLLHWKKNHKINCGKNENSPLHWKNDELFPEFEFESENEPDIIKNVMEFNGSSYGDIELCNLEISTDTLHEDEDETEVEVDSTFLKFEKRVARAPTQIIRYPVSNSRLNILKVNSNPETNIPACSFCSAPRSFEFQIMPQLLSHLELDPHDPHALDFGSMEIYTCSRNCEAEGFVDEFIKVEMFEQKGLGDLFRLSASKSNDKEL